MQALRKVFGANRAKREGDGIKSEKIDEESLDLCFVTPRIIVTGRPTTRETDFDDHRVNIDAISKWLEQQFSDNFVVWNLSSKNRNTIDYGKLSKSQVLEFQPFSRVDITDETPAIGQLFRIMYSLKFYLEWDPAAVAVIHCNTGILRTGFIVACFLAYEGIYPSVFDGLAFFGDIRLGNPQLVDRMPSSWRYLLQHMDRALAAAPSLPRVHSISHVVLRAGDLKQYLRGSYPLIQLFVGPKIIFDSSVDCVDDESIRWEADQLVVEIESLVICGDYQLWIVLPNEDGPPSPRGGPGISELGVHSDGDHVSGQLHDRSRTQKLMGSSPSSMVARYCFHTSMLVAGVETVGVAEIDVFRASLIDANSFSISLVLATVDPEVVVQMNLDRLLQRSFLNLRGMKALQQGANDFSSHHYTFPDVLHLRTLRSEGIDEVAAVCALQRGSNALGRAREFLDCILFKDIFKDPAALRDLKLLRETLTLNEIAAILSTRANVAVRKRGLQIGDLDFSALIEAVKAGSVGGGGGGGRGRGRGRGRGGGGGGGGDDEDEDAEEDPEDEEEDWLPDEDGDEDGGDASGLSALVSAAETSALFADDAAAPDDDEEEEEEEEEEEYGEWTMKEHPIFGPWYKAMAGGKARAELAAEIAKDGWSAELLDQDPAAVVPAINASMGPLGEWQLVQKYVKMGKVGLPRPVIEHAMSKEFLNPALLDADPSKPVLATDVTPQRKKKEKGPSIIRKKLHWVAIKGKVDNTVWYGPPADLIAAAKILIRDEREFRLLFTQLPDDGSRKKKEKETVSLLDPKRAMNAGIALAKLKSPVDAVVQCLTQLRAHMPPHLLSQVDLQNLVQIAPTDDELKVVNAFTGDPKRLPPVERFFLALARVPESRARAHALLYQCSFDERVRDSKARLDVFRRGVVAVSSAGRLKRLLKAILVLGNKMNGVGEPPQGRKGLVKAFTVASLMQLHITKTFVYDVHNNIVLTMEQQALEEKNGKPPQGKEKEAPAAGGNPAANALKAALAARKNATANKNNNATNNANNNNNGGNKKEVKEELRGGQSVLIYLIEILKKLDPDLLHLQDDFPENVLASAKRLSLDVLSTEVRELREGLTSLEATIRGATKWEGGVTAEAGNSVTSANGGAVYIKVRVDDPDDNGSDSDASTENANVPEKKEPETKEEDDSPASSASPDASPDASPTASPTGTPSTASPAVVKKKKKSKYVRRRVEPLAVFVSLAQTEVDALQAEYDRTIADYKGLLGFFKEDKELGSEDFFGALDSFVNIFKNQVTAMKEKKKKEKDDKRKKKLREKEAKRRAKRKQKEAAKEKEKRKNLRPNAGKKKDDDDDDDDDSEYTSNNSTESESESEPESNRPKTVAEKLKALKKGSKDDETDSEDSDDSDESDSDSDDSEDSDDSDDSDAPAATNFASEWNSIKEAAPEEEEEEETPEPKASSSASRSLSGTAGAAQAGGGMGGLLAQIKSKKKEEGDQADSETTENAKSPSGRPPSGDEGASLGGMAGVLAGIKAKKKDNHESTTSTPTTTTTTATTTTTTTTSVSTGGDSGDTSTSSAVAGGSPSSATGADESEEKKDRKAALMAMLNKRAMV